MKKLIPLLLVILFTQEINAHTFYEQLCKFNPNWKKYSSQAPKGKAKVFSSDKELIQAHLTNVISILKSNTVSHLDKEQMETRVHLIEVLNQYKDAGEFPQNYYREERIPVFIDEHKTHCAVGYLLQQTGYENIANRIASTNNYIWVKDIKDEALLKWQKKSGFTLEELKLIQGAYDFYMPNAFTLPNKYEVPQKPVCIVSYFDDKDKNPKIWLKGEGKNGVLNGLWEQNYSEEFPWIVGYFENNKRTGQWKEYYQGTDKLCRTENWRDDKLNGIRRRFNREGEIIEEILFKDGNAITKINYDLDNSLKWIREPLDSNLIWTEVFTFGGAPIASGHERVSNPGNLLWFQNIELTALNSAAITSRDISVESPSLNQVRLFSNPPLVEYKKEGDWIYYKQYANKTKNITGLELSIRDYEHFGKELVTPIQEFDRKNIIHNYDSIKATYQNNNMINFYGYGPFNHIHLGIDYQQTLDVYDYQNSFKTNYIVKEIGQYNGLNQKIGVWKHFNHNQELYKTENFLLPGPLMTNREEKRRETSQL